MADIFLLILKDLKTERNTFLQLNLLVEDILKRYSSTYFDYAITSTNCQMHFASYTFVQSEHVISIDN